MQTTDFVATVFDGTSNPNKVTVTFTMALNALLKGHTATIILMVEAVELGKPGATAGMAIGKPFEPVADLLAKYIEKGGRIAVCGTIAWYSGVDNPPPLPPVWRTVLTRRLRIEGFIVFDHYAHTPEFLAEVQPLVAAGQIKWRETIADGLDAAPAAFMGLLQGKNDGKQLVRIGADPG